MIIALLVLILLAVLFPGFVRAVFGLLGLLVLYMLIQTAGTKAEGTPIPWYPVEDACGGPGRSDNPIWMNECLKQEQYSYDFLQMAWDDVPEADRQKCMSTYGGQKVLLYTYLKGCAVQALTAQEVKREHKFRY